MAHLKCLKTYYLPCSSSSKLHSCIQSQDCRPLQNIVKYYTKCTNPMKRMEQSRNVEKALDCDKNTYRPSFQGFRKFIWMILSKYELIPMQIFFFTREEYLVDLQIFESKNFVPWYIRGDSLQIRIRFVRQRSDPTLEQTNLDYNSALPFPQIFRPS